MYAVIYETDLIGIAPTEDKAVELLYSRFCFWDDDTMLIVPVDELDDLL